MVASLNSQLSGRVDGDAELKGFADGSGFDAGADASPESGVEEDDVDGGVEHVGGELLEIYDDGIGGEGDASHFAGAAHAVQAEHRVLQIVVAQTLDGLAEADGLLGGPDAVGIEAE